MSVIKGKRINLLFAKKEDRRTIYDMLVSPETVHLMFDETHPKPTYEEFEEEEDFFYSGESNRLGSYMLIEYQNEIVGSVSYACGYEKNPYSELDIWMKSSKYTGKGLGREAINLVVEFVGNEYKISDFIIRPWIKNVNAIKAYKKCGFQEFPRADLKNYYDDGAYEKYGDGDYGIEDTVNLSKKK
ncbi:MAG: GNAT family N-acetyltransferase [Clostridiales bacterium]|nr:GNAT family N-acetyltransferase [Clostridiales bacterium]